MQIYRKLAGVLLTTCALTASAPASATTLNLSGYKLTFSDEFTTRSISQTGIGTTWADIRSPSRFDANSDIGFGRSSFLDAASGFDPFAIRNGALTITGVPYTVRWGYPGSWQSGLIHSRQSFVQIYGYFEMRARFNSVPGTWPAFWLLPVTTLHPNGRNTSLFQELDVVEQYGAYTQGVYANIHTTETAPPNVSWSLFSSHPEIASGYHTYGMDWEADTIKFYVDGVLMGTKPTPDDMTGPMYPIVDLARDGAYPGNAAAMTMDIDYVRAYSKNPLAVAVTQGVVSAPDGHDPGLYGAQAATAAPAAADRLTMVIAEDAYNGDCEFVVSLDGVVLGGVQTAKGNKAVPQILTFPVNVAKGNHRVEVNLLNPLTGGASKQRNLYIGSIAIDGVSQVGSALQSNGGAVAYPISVR